MKSQNDVFTVRTNGHGTVHLRDTRKATNKETSIAVLSDILALAVSNDGKHVAVAYCSMRPSLMVIAQPSNTDWAPVAQVTLLKSDVTLAWQEAESPDPEQWYPPEYLDITYKYLPERPQCLQPHMKKGWVLT